MEKAQSAIIKICDDIKDMLLKKNSDYGNSALQPVRIFSKTDSVEQIRVRIDDKLSRIANHNEKHFDDEDTVKDLIGYLILLLIAKGES